MAHGIPRYEAPRSTYRMAIGQFDVGKLKELLPAKEFLDKAGDGDPLRIGLDYMREYLAEGLVNEESSVLDMGCSIGRMAIPLTQVLTKGSYDGFDIAEDQIAEDTKNIESRFPNFRFSYLPVENIAYGRRGEDANFFVFPYDKDFFDLVLAMSLFTHMSEADGLKNYFAEAFRVMKPGGHGYFTFLFDDPDKSTDFTRYYSQAFIVKELQAAGFEIQAIKRGFMTHPHAHSGFPQDAIIVKKP